MKTKIHGWWRRRRKEQEEDEWLRDYHVMKLVENRYGDGTEGGVRSQRLVK